MVIKIAICDDNEIALAQIEGLLVEYKKIKDFDIVWNTFNSSIDLIEDIKGKNYDTILLNVVMPGISGIQTAEEIRSYDKIIKIVFLSAKPKFTADSYSVGAYGYLLKPVNSNELFTILDKIHKAAENNADSLIIKSHASIVRLPFPNIEYVEVMNKTVSFHLNDGNVVDTYASLLDFEPQILSRVEFLKVQRSYIVNMRFIKTLNSKSIITQLGHTIPVSKMMYAQIKETYMKYLFLSKAQAPKQLNKLPPIEYKSGIYRILLIDDEADQQSYWGHVLQAKGCSVDFAANIELARQLAAQSTYDCIVLDVMLFGESSFSQCKQLRELTNAPVVFLSCLSDSENQLQGFMAGGIDYITKDTPDDLFWAKIETRIRFSRTGKVQLVFEPLVLDISLRKALIDGVELVLTPTEFDLLWLMAEHSGRVYTPEELYQAVWGAEQWDGSQSIQVHLSRMRRKLEKACTVHCFIETVWGKGYRFVANKESHSKQEETHYATI